MDSAKNEQLTAKEIDARREAGLKQLLATPPTPHKPLGTPPKKPTKPVKA